MEEEKQMSDDEKAVLPESVVSEKPKRKRKKKSEMMEEFLKKQPVRGDLTVEPSEGIQREVVDKFKETVIDTKAENKSVERRKKMRKIALVVFAFILALGLAGTAGYFYFQNKKASSLQSSASSDNKTAAQETQSIKETIGKFMELPGDEEPVLATVKDVEKIKNQKFFANAENGDKVLIYTNNKKAILYRPSTNKIIEVSMLSGSGNEIVPAPAAETPAQSSEVIPPAGEESGTSTDTPAENTPVASAETPASVAVYNGGRISGLAQKIADSLAETAGIEIMEKTNATGKYQSTLVIDLSGSHPDLAQKIAETLDGEVAAMPASEIQPDADILIIGGSDFNKQSL